MRETFSIANQTKAKLPSLAFKRIKDSVLGPRYSLSLVFVGDTTARALNRRYRRKSYIPNVLSFPLSAREGEIFINPRRVKREAPQFEMSERTYLAFLFIHACLHLKGLHHGATMESIERRLLRRFKLS